MNRWMNRWVSYVFTVTEVSHVASKLSSANLYYILMVFLIKSWDMTLEDPHNY